MRRLLIVPVALALAAAAHAESRLFIGVGANVIRPADGSYRSIYGNQAIYPELAASIRLVKGLCLTGSIGQFSKSGKTPDLGLDARATQGYISVGLGYMIRASRLLCLEAGAGIAGMSFREEALDSWIKGRWSGIKAEGGLLLVPEDERIFMGVRFGYLSARVHDLDPGLAGPQPIQLGGARIAVVVGIQLFGND